MIKVADRGIASQNQNRALVESFNASIGGTIWPDLTEKQSATTKLGYDLQLSSPALQ